MGNQHFNDEDENVVDNDVHLDREIFLQLYIDAQLELADEYERHCTAARDEAHEAYRRDAPFTAIRRMHEALNAAVQARHCRERAAECTSDLRAYVRLLAQEFTEPTQADRAIRNETEAETGADDHPAPPPSL